MAHIATDPSLDRMFEQQRRSFTQKLEHPLPWWTFDAIDFIKAELTPNARVFEWGSGFSTLWMTRNGHRVIALEDNEEWYKTIHKRLEGTASDIRLTPLGDEYIKPDIPFAEFDLIIIDGRDRSQCCYTLIEQAKQGKLKSGAFILFDDAQRKHYFPAIKDLIPYTSAHYAFSDPSSMVMQEITSIFTVK